MKTFAFALALAVAAAATATSSGPSFAHPGGHDEEAPRFVADRPFIETRARQIVEVMIGRDVVEASWKGLAPTGAVLRNRGGQSEWLVTFTNPKVRDPAKRTLYVILDVFGGYIAANHTGN